MNASLNEPARSAASEIRDRTDLHDLIQRIALGSEQIARHLDPTPPEIVKTRYIATKLGCTTKWVGEMAGNGTIPKSCILAGTGNGKQWRFHRQKIDKWIAER